MGTIATTSRNTKATQLSEINGMPHHDVVDLCDRYNCIYYIVVNKTSFIAMIKFVVEKLLFRNHALTNPPLSYTKGERPSHQGARRWR